MVFGFTYRLKANAQSRQTHPIIYQHWPNGFSQQMAPAIAAADVALNGRNLTPTAI